MVNIKFILILSTILILSCSSSKDINESKSHSNKSPNAKFLEDDLDVKLWQERFENRDRDVYKNRDKIISALNLVSGESIADIGAGTGFFLKLLHEKVAPLGKVYAVEISPGFVQFLKARGKKENLTNLEVVKGGLDETNLKIGSVDKVFVCDTYHHFDRADLMLKDFKKILRPSGELVVVDFNRIEGKSRKWILEHIPMNKMQYIQQIEKYGFKFSHESKIGLEENFMLHFKVR